LARGASRGRQLDEIECVQEDSPIIFAMAERVEIGEAFLVAIDGFSIKEK
jgi:hypothetical protein